MKQLSTLLGALALASAGCGNSGGESGPVHEGLSFRTREGIQYSLGLNRYSNHVAIIDASGKEGRLGFYENQDKRVGDYFVLTDPANQFTRVLQFNGLDTISHVATFEDQATGGRQVNYERNTKHGDLVSGGIVYGFLVDETHRTIGIDQTGDGVRKNEEAPLVAVAPNGNLSSILEEDLLIP